MQSIQKTHEIIVCKTAEPSCISGGSICRGIGGSVCCGITGPLYRGTGGSICAETPGFGYSAIKNEYSEGQTASEKMRNLLGASNLEQEQKDLIFAVLHKYGSHTSYQLETLSHSEPPWLEARKGLKDFDHSSTVIDKGMMKSYYSSLVNVKE